MKEGREREAGLGFMGRFPSLCSGAIPSEPGMRLIKVIKQKSKWAGPHPMLRVCVCLRYLQDNRQVWKLNVKNRQRPRPITGRKNRTLTVQLMPIITVIKAHKWLHSALSLSPSCLPSLLLPGMTFCHAWENSFPLWVLSYRVARWGGFAPLFVPVKGKCQQKDSLWFSPSLQSFSDLLGHKLLYGL